MVKVTFETDDAKTEMSGKCVFAVVIDPKDEADIAAVLIGTTSPYDLIDAIGKGTGAQIAKICPDFKSKLKLIEIYFCLQEPKPLRCSEDRQCRMFFLLQRLLRLQKLHHSKRSC